MTFYERTRGVFWPWLLLIAVMVVIAYFWYNAGVAAQRRIDGGADNRRGSMVAPGASHWVIETLSDSLDGQRLDS